MLIEMWRCPTCPSCHYRPWTTCPRCQPKERYEEQEKFAASALEARPMSLFNYSFSMLVLVEGKDGQPFYAMVRDARHFIEGEWQGSTDKLISDLNKVKEENRDLLVENARLRRRLEGK